MKKAIAFRLLFILCLTASEFVLAQKGKNIDSGEIEDAEIIVEKNKKIDLPEAARNFEKIIVPPRPRNIEPQTYQFSNFTPTLQPEAIKYPAKMANEEELEKLYGGFLRAGAGNYKATFVEVFFHQKRSKDNDYGIHFRHNAFGKGAVKNAGNSDNLLRGFASKNVGKLKISGEGSYQRERYNFFGYDQQAEANKNISADSVKQVFQNIRIAGSVANSSEDKLHYHVKAGFSRFSDRFDVVENEINLQTKLVYALDEKSGIQVLSDIAFIPFKDSTSLTRALVPIQVGYYYQKDALKLLAGGNVVFSNDTVSPERSARIYPMLRADYSIVSNKLSAFLQIDGNTEKRTYQSFARENPFLDRKQVLTHTNKRIAIKGGATANVQQFTFQVSGGYATFSNLSFYVNNLPDSSKFLIVYEKENVGRAELNIQAAYQLAKSLQMGANFTLHGYNFTKQDSLNSKRPYHRPTQMASLWASYNVKDKILVKTSWQYAGGITAFNVNTGENVELKPISDLDFQIDYRFSEKFSAFLNFDNIISQKNQRYLYYTNRGFALLAGLTYSF